MLKRTLFFSTPYCLSLRNGQMIIHTREAPDQRKSIPIEDIGFVVLEDQQNLHHAAALECAVGQQRGSYPVRREPNAERLVDEFGFKQNAR